MKKKLMNIDIPGDKTFPIFIKRNSLKTESPTDLKIQLKFDLSGDPQQTKK
ncbi:hypothetical protein [Bacillus sp. FJAT-27916]|uniref:hypothetical protein n=1 Tax=Bacillus sp. FJAT-27916 TaxID=1679169 RepID=UPI0012E17803|nr:hypothetical protein [Bacillus sp. FJAT-27916]